MPIYINIVCDGNRKEKCENAQNVAFDHTSETFQDLLTTLATIGWEASLNHAKCPDCVHKDNFDLLEDRVHRDVGIVRPAISVKVK